MLCGKEILEETEKRHKERTSQRETMERQIKTGDILHANTPERVHARLKRLGLDERITDFFITSQKGSSQPAWSGISYIVPTDHLPKGKEARKQPATARVIDPTTPKSTRPPTSGMPMEDTLNDLILERIIGRNDLMAISYMDLGLRASRSVACVRLFENQRHIGSGTGFMVSPRLLLTNNHVLRDVAKAREARVVFNFQDDPDGNALITATFALDPNSFFLTSPKLDYTLVAVTPRSRDGQDLEGFGWNRLVEDVGKILNGEYVTIIQHPNGQPKQIALRENKVIDVLEDFIHYHTDTAPGSSGSPVFNDQWEVVCLHHSGVPKKDKNGNILTRKNTILTKDTDDDEIQWIANEGVRVSRIVKHVREQALGETGKRLRDQLFDGMPPKPIEAGTTVPYRKGSSGDQYGQASSSGYTQIEKGVATWTIPLRISIQVGGSISQGEPSRPSILLDSSGQNRSGAEPMRSTLDNNVELQSYLEEARQARTKPYYDKTQDTKDKKSYYAPRTMIMGGNTPTDLYKKLSDLVTSTHSTEPKYNPAKELYPWIDLHPNLKLRSIYSGKEFTPEELIREDFRVDQERAIRIKELSLREASLGAERLQEEIDLLEAALPYNCEHVVPQSWFGKHEPMKGDLHHLFACESGCNSFRGNIPYYDFPDFEEAVRDKCGKREENKFEPGGGKGTVARATLYFLLRYPGEINQTSKEYTKDRIKTLLRWHQDYPVDNYEKHRNMAIFQKQGNRNPLIDHPEWAKKINFDLGLG